MKDYFDSNGHLLIKLYKKIDENIVYWETWDTDDTNAIVHWGNLGEYGEQDTVSRQTPAELKKEINTQIENKIREGYAEISIRDHYTVAITFQLETWGSAEDLEKREQFRGWLTGMMGWTGNGRCDDGDIGSGEMALYADVVDPYLAIALIKQEFERNNIPDKYHFSITKGNEIIS